MLFVIFPVGRFCQKLFDKLWDGELATLSQFHRSKSNSQQDDGADGADSDIDDGDKGDDDSDDGDDYDEGGGC